MEQFLLAACPGPLRALAKLCVADARAEESEVPGAAVLSYPAVASPFEASPQWPSRLPAAAKGSVCPSPFGVVGKVLKPLQQPPAPGLLLLPTPARAAPRPASRVPQRCRVESRQAMSEAKGCDYKQVVTFDDESGIAEATEGAWPARLCPPASPRQTEEPPSPLDVSLLMRAHLAREGQHVYVWRGGRRSLVNSACIRSPEGESFGPLEPEPPQTEGPEGEDIVLDERTPGDGSSVFTL
uniref:Uncharacterized protein n=1 Tax=Alexandrium monilatum TaxID=311494 RepID=A0A7S4PWV3_9DINO